MSSALSRRQPAPRLPELEVLGGSVRRARVAQGMTQEHLAELADLNIRTLQKIEAGQINILVTTVLRLQRALRCRWGELLPVEEPPSPETSLSRNKKSRPLRRTMER